MKKSDLVAAVQEAIGVEPEIATKAVNTVFDTILSSLANGEQVIVTGFGAFRTAHKEERDVRNPRTGEAAHVTAHERPQFSFSESVRMSFRDGKQSKFIKE